MNELQVLFVGTGLAISALPVIARTLMDLHLLRTELGLIVMGAATVNDLVGWAIFVVILDSMQSGGGASHLLLNAGLLVTLMALIIGVGPRLLESTIRFLQTRLRWPAEAASGVIIIAVLITAAATNALGIHAAFGAYLSGVTLARCRTLTMPLSDMTRQLVPAIDGMLYFTTVGLSADIMSHFDLELVLVLVAVASIGKVVGGLIGGRVAKMPPKIALAVGVGLNSRGAMEILLASTALEYGLIDQRLFVALVVVAVVTSITSGPIMRRLLASSQPDTSSGMVPSRLIVANDSRS